MNIEDKLFCNKFNADSESHLVVDQDICRTCVGKPCLTVCPVKNYTLENGQIVVSFEGCLECGSCRIVCGLGGLSWKYPRGGKGICYRFG